MKKRFFQRIRDDLLKSESELRIDTDREEIETKQIGVPAAGAVLLVVVCSILVGMAVKDAYAHGPFWAVLATFTGFVAAFLCLGVAVNWVVLEMRTAIIELAKLIIARNKPPSK